ncbi:hypothetical protein DC738_08245 [Salmonella enterica subsp. enterica serovar Rubislaw]|nr:hypothetical protein [Salmonella enterica subsp. enterica]EEE9450576.1 hypothetical protein [Salmonella enterica subsp. enterica serovar Rubislaw]EEK8033207.1 hypothetical protein [Salmonella enterica subsp. enterica serovar Montevideo]EDV4789683.1 hypothetical protein [Salmonella enterica subsp. enterica]EEK8036730.1 hypothetical protein [Salmonella enterica subsp. enterica serovar Montevideo]
MNQPQVSIFPAEMTTALYRRAIASAWRQKALTETGCDQYGPHSLTVERIEMAITLHIECALINEYGEAQGAAAALALLTDMLEPSLLTAPPVLTVRGCEVMAELYRTLPAAFDDFCSTGVALHKGEV